MAQHTTGQPTPCLRNSETPLSNEIVGLYNAFLRFVVGISCELAFLAQAPFRSHDVFSFHRKSIRVISFLFPYATTTLRFDILCSC